MINIAINQDFRPGQAVQVGSNSTTPGLRPGDFVLSEEQAKAVYNYLVQLTKQEK